MAASVSFVRTRTKLPRGVIGPRIFLPSSVHDPLDNVASAVDIDSEVLMAGVELLVVKADEVVMLATAAKRAMHWDEREGAILY